MMDYDQIAELCRLTLIQPIGTRREYLSTLIWDDHDYWQVIEYLEDKYCVFLHGIRNNSKNKAINYMTIKRDEFERLVREWKDLKVLNEELSCNADSTLVGDMEMTL
jgi:hypothetical protein